MSNLKPPFTHYSIDKDGIITVVKTRRHSPAGEVIPHREWRGMLRVKLTDDTGKPRQCWVHNLVWNTYAVEKLEKGERIVFVDSNPLNPSFDNLAVVKHGDKRPVIHPDYYLIVEPPKALVIGAKKSDWRGTENPNAKLDDYTIFAIRYGNKRITQDEMAEKLGVSQATISYIINNKTWKHVKVRQDAVTRRKTKLRYG